MNPTLAMALCPQEFRIESQVYVETSSLPVSQNVTLFSQGVAYDFQMSNEAQPTPVETVIFESRTKMLVILDPVREVRLELPDLRLVKIVDSMRRELAQDVRTKFLVEDRFKEDNDWATGWVTLESPRLIYRYSGARPKNAAILPIYYEFLDAITQMKATDPTQPPPFPRIELNNSIRQIGWMPTEVQKTVKAGGLYKKEFKAHSKHVVVNQLSNVDRERIAKAKLQWMNFKVVDLAEYRGLNSKGILRNSAPKIDPSINANVASKSNPQVEHPPKDVKQAKVVVENAKLDAVVKPASHNQMLAPILSQTPNNKSPKEDQ